MRLGLSLLLFVSLAVQSFADDWPVGAYTTMSHDVELGVLISHSDNHQVNARVSWSTNDALGISAGSAEGAWEAIDDAQVRLTLGQSPLEYFELKRTSFGELILIYFSTDRPELNTTSFLKPDQRAQLSFDNYTATKAMAELPDASVWVDYINNDIWPFWRTDTAATFSSYRCDDGTLPELDDLCPELNSGWLKAGLSLDYTRMVSRQTYAYGVIFHMTGEPHALALMNQGVEILRKRIDEKGQVATVLENGESIWQGGQSTSQDLAYAQVGLAMAYYLTGDPKLLATIEQVKQNIFTTYKRDDWNMLAWTTADQQVGDSQQQELVAQLDQLNAYMLLIYPLLEGDQKAQWQRDITWVVDVLLSQFHIADEFRFAGQLIDGQPNRAGDRHNDYGHSVKAYWMILQAADLIGNESWRLLAEQGIKNITANAFRYHQRDADFSTWANQKYSGGSSWWEFAELTQAAATMTLVDKEFTRYLPESYRTWTEQYTDSNVGGVWMGMNAGAKQHLWKNGYHETELALVAYITTALLTEKPFSLFYAKEAGYFQPYYFNANVTAVIPVGLGRTRVIYSNQLKK